MEVNYKKGGGLDNQKEFINWFKKWYNKDIFSKINIWISIPTILHNLGFEDKNGAVLELFEKRENTFDAKPYLREIIKNADKYGINLYLVPTPRYKYIKDKSYKEKITKEYLIEYYTNFGFEPLKDNQYFVRYAKESGVLLAPNGKPSNLTREQWHLVRTKAFKDWFGDWENDPKNASKVVDENGEPLVVYHGTSGDLFYEFMPFAIDYYNGQAIKEFRGNRTNEEFDEYIEKYGLRKIPTRFWFSTKHLWGNNFLACFLKIKNMSITDEYEPKLPIGVDGFRVPNEDGIDYYSVSQSEQIKLADGTNTTFDSNTPDIRYESGGEIENFSVQEFEEYLEKKYNATIDLLDYKSGDIYIGKIIIPKDERSKGIGSRIMEEIVNYSNIKNRRLTLTPSVDYGASSVSRLKEFYKNFGFLENKGRNKDYSIREAMYKNPDIRFEDGGKIKDYKTIASFEDFTVKIYDGKLGYKDLLRETGEMPKNIEHIEVVYNDTDFGDFYEYSKKQVAKMFGSEFEQGYPTVEFIKDKNSLTIEEAFGILKNGENVYYSKDKLEWCMGYAKGGELSGLELINQTDGFGEKYSVIVNGIKQGSISFSNGTYFASSNSTQGGKSFTSKFFDTLDKAKKYIYNKTKDIYPLNKSNIFKQMGYEKGGKLDDKEEIYKKWKSLVNMSKSELENFYNSEEGKKAGLSSSEAKSLGIHSGRESARWIMKMKDTPKSEWTPTMWKWAKRQISFISRMSGNKGGLYDDKGNKTRKHTSLLIWGHNPEKHKSGGTIAQTPAPKEDKIYGSKVNVKGSSKDTKSAKEIKFDAKTLLSISNKVKEHNKQHPDKKVTLATAKAVVRRGMGAYSSTHRPTISGGKPNSRVAWGLARLNAFMYKIVHGKSKSGKYSQDDDLINELGYKVKSYANGGEISDVKSFYDWFCDWYKNGVCKKMNIMISVPNKLTNLLKAEEDNAMILDLFEKIDQSIDAKKYMDEMLDKADQYGVILYTKHNPSYQMFGFEPTLDNYMKRFPSLYKDGGDVELLAPNGKPSNLTSEQWHLVRTKAFKDWFGDWENDPENSSKVVDENGEPLVVYHRSKNKFNFFKEGDGIGWIGSGVYFSNSKTEFKKYGKILYETFLNIRNPFIMVGDSPSDLSSELKKMYNIDYSDLPTDISIFLKENGYDGVILNHWDFGYIYNCYYPNQIKLADGTNTTFDGNNPDIRFEDGGKVEKLIQLPDVQASEEALARVLEMQGYKLERKTYSKGGRTFNDAELLNKYKKGESIGFTAIAHLKSKGLIERADGAKRKSIMEDGGIFKPYKKIEQIAKEKNISLSYAKIKLKKGMKVESEHSDDKKVQEIIALQHLDEDIKYYDKK